MTLAPVRLIFLLSARVKVVSLNDVGEMGREMSGVIQSGIIASGICRTVRVFKVDFRRFLLIFGENADGFVSLFAVQNAFADKRLYERRAQREIDFPIGIRVYIVIIATVRVLPAVPHGACASVVADEIHAGKYEAMLRDAVGGGYRDGLFRVGIERADILRPVAVPGLNLYGAGRHGRLARAVIVNAGDLWRSLREVVQYPMSFS